MKIEDAQKAESSFLDVFGGIVFLTQLGTAVQPFAVQ
jgi:hypothetical protein